VAQPVAVATFPMPRSRGCELLKPLMESSAFIRVRVESRDRRAPIYADFFDRREHPSERKLKGVVGPIYHLTTRSGPA
jgi:hypothetical protein